MACFAVLIWYYALPNVLVSELRSTQRPGWTCKILNSVTTADELLISSVDLLQALNPQVNLSVTSNSSVWFNLTALRSPSTARCLSDLVLAAQSPGAKGIPALTYDFGGKQSSFLQALTPCPTSLADSLGNPLTCLADSLKGYGTLPVGYDTSTPFVYIAPNGFNQNLSDLIDGVMFSQVLPSSYYSNSETVQDIFFHVALSNFNFPTYESCLSDLYVSCESTETKDFPFLNEVIWDGYLSKQNLTSPQAAATLPWTEGTILSTLSPGYQNYVTAGPTLNVTARGYHRWQLCTLYPSSEAETTTEAATALGSFYWLDNQFMGALAVPTPQLVHTGAPLLCGVVQCSITTTCATVQTYGLIPSQTPADCAYALGFPTYFTLENISVPYGPGMYDLMCCTNSCDPISAATCLFDSSPNTSTYSFTASQYADRNYYNRITPTSTYQYVFEHNQTCSASVIAGAINDMTSGPSALKHAFCDRLQSLPPYLCTQMTRRPVLEILSLAAANALSGLAAYFGIAAFVTQLASKRGKPNLEGTTTPEDATMPEEAPATPDEDPTTTPQDEAQAV